MIAFDTNILVYAHRSDSEWHAAALAALTAALNGRWAIAWPCVHEFLSVVTDSRSFRYPTPMERAIDQMEAWMESPTLNLLGETERHWRELTRLIRPGRMSGRRVHDARIAAICIEHGVSELWSADRDFSRVTGLAIRNPLVQ